MDDGTAVKAPIDRADAATAQRVPVPDLIRWLGRDGVSERELAKRFGLRREVVRRAIAGG